MYMHSAQLERTASSACTNYRPGLGARAMGYGLGVLVHMCCSSFQLIHAWNSLTSLTWALCLVCSEQNCTQG